MKKLALVVLFLSALLSAEKLFAQGIRYDDMGAKRVNDVTLYLPFDVTDLLPWQVEDMLVHWFQSDPKASIYTEGWNADFRIPDHHLTERVQIAAIKKNTAEFTDIPESLLTITVVEFALRQDGLLLGKVADRFKYPTACLIALSEDSGAWEFIPTRLRANSAFRYQVKLLADALVAQAEAILARSQLVSGSRHITRVHR